MGATAGLDKASAPWLVVDIGGGSTEFSFGSDEPDVHVSVPMGSVRFTEDYIPSDPPLPEELSAAISVVHLYLDDIVRDHPQVAESSTMIAVAGTATTIAAVEIGLDPYDPEVIDSFALTRAAAEDVFRTLATESIEDRKWNPGLQPERADVIVGGCCILVAIMRHLDLDACLIRESDLLDGMAEQLLNG
jgi:exopolyphosphatase / guanosine-5'-triphosphate,3'-diphosphate pyrophosphatase